MEIKKRFLFIGTIILVVLTIAADRYYRYTDVIHQNSLEEKYQNTIKHLDSTLLYLDETEEFIEYEGQVFELEVDSLSRLFVSEQDNRNRSEHYLQSKIRELKEKSDSLEKVCREQKRINNIKSSKMVQIKAYEKRPIKRKDIIVYDTTKINVEIKDTIMIVDTIEITDKSLIKKILKKHFK